MCTTYASPSPSQERIDEKASVEYAMLCSHARKRACLPRGRFQLGFKLFVVTDVSFHQALPQAAVIWDVGMKQFMDYHIVLECLTHIQEGNIKGQSTGC